MEQLVICFTSSDECTFAFEQAIPVEYESAEQLLIDAETALIRYNGASCIHHGHTVAVGDLIIDINVFQHHDGDNISFAVPEILSLQEWFERYKSTTV